MKKLLYLLPLVLMVLVGSCTTDSTIKLFNGKDLDNWEIFVSNNDLSPEDLFWVEDGLIHTSGIPNGYIRTKESYNNFQLHVEWRWVDEPVNSGVLIHVQGEDMIWPLAIECQLMHEHAGDVVLIGKGAGISIRDSSYLVTSEEDRYIVIPKKEEVSEHPAGEWNSYDITALNGTLEVKVNNILQNTGSNMTLSGGSILLQGEGAPMQFRNITLKPL